jgi:methylenetetrahydrofolate dehydrogenase (NADP+)/methenyltetrahydrofolate cyclohydrolase
MSALVLDGRKISDQIRSELRPRIEALVQLGHVPGLAVVLVGENPASQIYVRNKVKACQDLGIKSFQHTLSSSISTEELLSLIQSLNDNADVDGILVQMPLPPHIEAQKILLAVDPQKDADGFHPLNVGNLVANRPAPRSCTPAGIMELLKRNGIPMQGKNAVVVGRSDIVGKPMAFLLLNESATVTVCHSRTRDLAAECRHADILVAALGRAAFITRDFIKPGAVVVDVGINRITDPIAVAQLFGHDQSRLAAFAKNGSVVVGDVDPRAMAEIASAYTPVPGGVGPLTIAMLMANTVTLAEQHCGAGAAG